MKYVKAVYAGGLWCIWRCETWRHKMELVASSYPFITIPQKTAPFRHWAHENFDEDELVVLTEEEAFLEMI